MAKPTTTKSSGIQVFRVSYYWADPEQPPSPPPFGWKGDEPFQQVDVMSVPRLGESVSVELPAPVTLGISPSTAMAHGRVLAVEKVSRVDYRLYIKREGRLGLGWAELCAFIGTRAVAYHEMIGRVEGELICLHPKAELAGLRVPELKDLETAIIRRAVAEGDLEADVLEDLTGEDPVIWVAWSSLWPLSVLNLNLIEPPGKGTRRTR